jgi:hypothetical protein
MIYIHKKTRGGWRCGSSSRVCLVRTKPFVQTSVPLKKEKRNTFKAKRAITERASWRHKIPFHAVPPASELSTLMGTVLVCSDLTQGRDLQQLQQ